MPFYQYFCEVNGETLEVNHPMAVRLRTWAAVCLLARVDPGDTPGEAPVQRLMSRAVPAPLKYRNLDKEKPSGAMEL